VFVEHTLERLAGLGLLAQVLGAAWQVALRHHAWAVGLPVHGAKAGAGVGPVGHGRYLSA
jgi:hypothetical protein